MWTGTSQDPQTKYDLKVDLDKAALHGISPADVTRTLQVGLSGVNAGLLHDPQSREDIPIEVRLARVRSLGNRESRKHQAAYCFRGADRIAGGHEPAADHD